MAILQLHNADIYYEFIDGEKDSPCLVFLHEGLGCTAMWKTFPKNLCEKTSYCGLVYDRLGYGRSSSFKKSRTIHYLHEYALNELPEILSALIPETPYILIGHSDGGSISLIHASEQPSLLRGVITESAHVFVEDMTLEGIRAAGDAYNAGKLKKLADFHGDKTDFVFKAWYDTWLSSGFAYWNIEYLLPSVECPVLVVQGIGDQYGSYGQVASIASGISGKSQTAMIPDCGHVPHIEAADAVLETMHNFLMTIR